MTREPMLANLPPAEAARLLGLKPQTLANWRVSGKGPRYSKRGNKVFYSMKDLEEFDKGCRRLSTSDDTTTRGASPTA